MSISAIRVRYAKAFFETAKENNILDTIQTDIQKILNVCINSADFVGLLDSPVINTSLKAGLMTKIFDNEIHPLTLKFLLLITNNKREIHIPGICKKFIALTQKEQNIRPAILITATDINEAATHKIKSLIEKELNAKLELSKQIKPGIIGGIILRIDDLQYDASVINQLRKIEQSLLESEL